MSLRAKIKTYLFNLFNYIQFFPAIFISLLIMAFNPDGLSTLDLQAIFTDENKAFQFAFEADLLADGAFCGEDCHGVLKITHDSNQKFNCRVICPICGQQKSIFYTSFMTRSKLPVNKCLHLLYCWAMKESCESTAYQVHVNPDTVTNFFQCFRDACVFWVEYFSNTQIGGPGKTVEIDESLMVKRKHNVGRFVGNMDQWIFGGICREDGTRFVVQVPDRTSVTLLQEIQDHIDPASNIISDSFRSYNCLTSFGYNHQTVNHSQNFVDPTTGAHTQKVERMWRDVKESRKRYVGIPNSEVESHLAEYSWRKNCGVTRENAFRKAIELIRECNFY